MLALADFRARPRSNEHEHVPEWLRRVLQAHDSNLDLVWYRWWAGSSQSAGEAAEGRFLVMVRLKNFQRSTSPPITADGQINLREWGVIHVVEDEAGNLRKPDRSTIVHVLTSDRGNVTPGQWIKETRVRSERAREKRREARRAERSRNFIPEAIADLKGRVTSLVPAIGGARG